MKRSNSTIYLSVLLLIAIYLQNGKAYVTCDGSKPNYGCSYFARCDTVQGECHCNPGFVGDGGNCESSCLSNETTLCVDAESVGCIDLPDDSQSYGCACKEGYYFNTVTSKCQDFNECTRRSCSSYSECTNSQGDFSCECCYSEQGTPGISGFGYVNDGKTRCHADAIVHFGDSLGSIFMNSKGNRRVSIPGGFPFFGQLYWDIYIHSKGLITFDSPDAPYFGGDVPTFAHLKFVAPFWTELEPLADGVSGVYIDFYADVPNFQGSLTSDFLPHFGDWIGNTLPGFEPKVIVVATWLNMTASPPADFASDSQASRITFQSVLASNGTHSLGFTSYSEQPKHTEWTLPLDSVYIGSAGENFASDYPASQLSDLFQSPPDVDNYCADMTFLTLRGRWHKIFGPSFVKESNLPCIDEASRQFCEYGNFGLDDFDLYCPCSEQQALSDNRFVITDIDMTSDDRKICLISRFFKNTTFNERLFSARAYCCYDPKGALITDGVLAGGVVPDGREDDMFKLKDTCCADPALCPLFHLIYNPVTCQRYDRPRITYVRGADHFNSFTNAHYSFNGRGEYKFLATNSPEVEAQIRLVNESYSDKQTSFIKALAIQCKVPADNYDTDPTVRITEKAEIHVNASGHLQLLLNGNNTQLPHLPFEFDSMFYAACDGEFCEVACKFASYIFSFQATLVNKKYLEVNASVPSDSEAPVLNVQGIVGSVDGVLEYMTNTVDDYENDTQIFAFGEAQQTTEKYSLFTYDADESWSTFNNISDGYLPTFWSDIKAEVADNLAATWHCQADYACIYDQLVTGNKDISMATFEALSTIETDRNALATRTALWQNASSSLVLSVHQDFSRKLSDFVGYDEFGAPPFGSRDLIEPDYYEIETTISKQYYQFDASTGDFTIFTTKAPIYWQLDTYRIAFFAVTLGEGSAMTRSRYSPRLFVCACKDESQCDFSYVDRDFMELPANDDNFYQLPCHCPPQSRDRYCDGTNRVCYGDPCSANARCQPDESASNGYVCTCDYGFEGNGFFCQLSSCSENVTCSHSCQVDPITLKSVCECDHGFVLDTDGATCIDINECNFPATCSQNEICRNTAGSYYCECEAGYKPKKGSLRSGCMEAPFTYVGTLQFSQYWDPSLKEWMSWTDTLMPQSSADHNRIGRMMEPSIELLLNMIEPTNFDFYTFIYEFVKTGDDTMKVHYKFFPTADGQADLFQRALQEYFTSLPDASIFKNVSAVSVSQVSPSLDQCDEGCGTPFASCQISDAGKECRCNPGFIDANGAGTECNSYCFARQCKRQSTHTCRDLANYGPQCLCKRGYRMPEGSNECEMINYCTEYGSNPCGFGGICKPVENSYKCTCLEGYLETNRPWPSEFCAADVLYFKDAPMPEPSWPDNVVTQVSGNYTKIMVPVGFPFGETNEWIVFVGHDGSVSLGHEPTATEAASHFPSSFAHIIAPLWADFVGNATSPEILVYDRTSSQLTTQWQTAIEQLRRDIELGRRSYPYFNSFGYELTEDPSYFNPKTIIAVTWKKAALKPFSDEEYATFQMILASDGVATVVVVNFDGLMSWIDTWKNPDSGSYSHRGFAGFQLGSRRFCFTRAGFLEETLGVDCRDFHFGQLTSSIAPLVPGGKHIFLLANQQDASTVVDRECFDTLVYWKRDRTSALQELTAVHRAAFRSDEADLLCPPTQTEAQRDRRFSLLLGPSGKQCFVKRFWTEFPYEFEGNTKTANIGQFCCYRMDALLIQSGDSQLMVEEFLDIQRQFSTSCCLRSHHCLTAAAYASPPYASGYKAPDTAAVFGDPHLVNAPGFSVTFKGRGDYVLLDSASAKLQGRFDAMSGGNGSALMAVAWKVASHTGNITIDPSSGNVTITQDGNIVDLSEHTNRGGAFDKNGDIYAILDVDDRVESVTVTFVDGLSFHIVALRSFSVGPFFQLRVSVPKSKYEDARGLLADFYYPNGDTYDPVKTTINGTMFISDKDYFIYGKNWTVENSGGMSLFNDLVNVDDSFIPQFYDGDLMNMPVDEAIFDACQGSIPCIYDYLITGDADLAMSTLIESETIQQLRREASEVPPQFGENSLVWIMRTQSRSFEYTPTMEGLYQDVRFTMDTDFPRHLYTLEPGSGRFVIKMSDEARQALLHDGPFHFMYIARRGATGASAFRPIAVRICNCLDESTCDFADDNMEALDIAEKVGIIPTENAQHYSVARCKCLPHMSGENCDYILNSCADSPCYPGAPCAQLSPNDTETAAFRCGKCPSDLIGDGIHCLTQDLCENVECESPKICQVVSGSAVCLCPPGSVQADSGECEYINRCTDDSQFGVCRKRGMRCNDAGMGNYYCDCMPGYAPFYELTLPPTIESCRSVAYTYHGQVRFDYFYDVNKNLVPYSESYGNLGTEVAKMFALNATADLKNAINLLKYDAITSVSIANVSSYPPFNGFIVDYLAYSAVSELSASEIENGLGLYLDQTQKAGTLVHIKDPRYTAFFVDICKSTVFNPCSDIADIAVCMQPGVPGLAPMCQCNTELAYLETPETHPDGTLECIDDCDNVCKKSDANSQCTRNDGRDKPHTCICSPGFVFNETLQLCEERPPVCTPSPCGSNAECVPDSDGIDFKCECKPYYTPANETTCMTFCESVNYCRDFDNAVGCTSSENSFTCSCSPGFQWDHDSSTCQDIDECNGDSVCPLHSTCFNGVGNYTCQCDSSYLPVDPSATGSDLVCFAHTQYPYNFAEEKVFIQDSDSTWNTTFLGGFNYNNWLYFKVFVNFDGFISFDELPPHKYVGTAPGATAVAPFWLDLDVASDADGAGLYIDVFDKLTAKTEETTKWAASFAMAVDNLNAEDLTSVPFLEDTIPDMMIIATWKDVSPAPASSYGQYKTTFQAVLTMTSAGSFVIFNYVEDKTTTNWPTVTEAAMLQPLVGYTTRPPHGYASLNVMNGDPADFNALFTDDGKQIRGRHVVAFGNVVKLRTRQCITEYSTFPEDNFNVIKAINKDTSFFSKASCPGYRLQIAVDPRWHVAMTLYESGAFCYEGSFWTSVSVGNETYRARSVCCYDGESGAFLDNTQQHVGSFFWVEQFAEVQESLFESCCQFSYYCEAFSQKHPSSGLSPSNYMPPAIGYVVGDPHLGILMHHVDNERPSEITFNGQGEYTLVKTGDINMQIRFTRDMSITSRATVATGIAAKIGSLDTVEIIIVDENLHIFRAGNEIKDLPSVTNLTEIADESQLNLWTYGNSIGFVSFSGVSFLATNLGKNLEVRVSWPRELNNHDDPGKVCGLLASFDADEEYLDCDNNPTLGPVMTDEVLAYDFGQNFKLKNAGDSLFSYKPGYPSFDDVNTVEEGWTPVFYSEVAGSLPDDSESVCGKSKACLYDYGVTFDKTFAHQTQLSSEKYQADQLYIVTDGASITNTENSVTVRTADSPSSFTLDVDSDYDDFNSEIVFSIDTNLPENLYLFNESNGLFSMSTDNEALPQIRRMDTPPYIRFWVMHKASVDIWTPATFTCACQEISQCDFDQELVPNLERYSNIRHNYFLPCHCPPTRRGTFCEYDFDPCTEDPCPNNVQCNIDETSSTGFTCGECPDNYISVDGVCKPKLCSENHCTNGKCFIDNDGQPSCNCFDGYEANSTESSVCQDINECKLGSHDCYRLGTGMQCNNVPGSWSCSCKPGYSPDNSSNIQNCIKENYQLDATLKVDSILVDSVSVTWSPELAIVGSPEFTSVAKQMEIDLLNWYRVDLNQPDVKSVFVKTLSEGSIKSDYSVYFSNAVDASDIASQQAAQLASNPNIGSMVGADPSSVTITEDLCVLDTSCDSTSTRCVWQSGTTTTLCECLSGFVPLGTSSTACIDDCTNICHSRNGTNSQCTRNVDSFTCDCLPYFSSDASGQCVDKCASLPCQNGGTCGLVSDSFFCKCTDKFTGDLCQTAIVEGTTKSPETSDDTTLIIVASVLGAVILILVGFIAVYAIRKRSSGDDNDSNSKDLEVRKSVPSVSSVPPPTALQGAGSTANRGGEQKEKTQPYYIEPKPETTATLPQDRSFPVAASQTQTYVDLSATVRESENSMAERRSSEVQKTYVDMPSTVQAAVPSLYVDTSVIPQPVAAVQSNVQRFSKNQKDGNKSVNSADITAVPTKTAEQVSKTGNHNQDTVIAVAEDVYESISDSDGAEEF